MNGGAANNLNFWVGAGFAGVGLAMVVLFGGDKWSAGLQALIAFDVISGFVLMVRYPLRRKRPG